MESNLTAYFRFQIDKDNPRFLTLSRRYGTIPGLKGIENRIIKLRFTYSCKVFLQMQNTGLKYAKMRLLNTLDLKKNGIAHFDSLPHAVLVIFDPVNSIFELFIAPGKKGYSYLLFQKLLLGELDHEMMELRRKPQPTINRSKKDIN
jgi:hypothetical protein